MSSYLYEDVVQTLQKRILADFMDLFILSMMYNNCNAIGGYDIIRCLHKRFGFLPSPGTVYSHVYSLERKGLIKAKKNRRKRVYSLTDKGRKYVKKLFDHKEYIKRFFANVIFKNGAEARARRSQ